MSLESARLQGGVTDYSQSGEQATVLELAGKLPKGNFLDIGAGDGVTFSNTRALALAGWQGLVVEPAAWAFDLLVDLYADSAVTAQPVIPVCAIVTPEPETVARFAYSRGDHLSSIDPEHVRKWSSQVPFRNVYGATVALAELLDTFGPFSVVSIDAEGITQQLVRRYRLHPYWGKVRLIVYEHDGGRTEKLPTFEGWQLVARTANNVIYAR